MNLPLTPSSVDVLLFDLGRVVLDISFDKVMANWAGTRGLRARRPRPALCRQRQFQASRDRPDRRRGVLCGPAPVARHRPHRRPVPRRLERDLHRRDAGNCAAAGRAAQRLPLYAFSNTNPAHVAHFSQAYAGVLGHFREIFLSSSIGLRKPDAEAYDHVVKAIGVPASRILFFDDSAANIEGARARGLCAVHVTSTDDVARALTALEV